MTRTCVALLAVITLASGCVSTAAPRGDGPPPAGGPEYTVTQATSDRAQLHTIAFDCFGFLTGSIGADSFFPPGKVADWWGSPQKPEKFCGDRSSPILDIGRQRICS